MSSFILTPELKKKVGHYILSYVEVTQRKAPNRNKYYTGGLMKSRPKGEIENISKPD